MRWMKADHLVKGDWIDHDGQEWSIAAHPAPVDVTVPGSRIILSLSRIGGAQRSVRVPPQKLIAVTRPWPHGAKQ